MKFDSSGFRIPVTVSRIYGGYLDVCAWMLFKQELQLPDDAWNYYAYL